MPSSGPGASAPSSPDAELLPAPVVPAPDCWLALASALASGFLFPQPVRAMDAANTINSTSVLRITFDSQNPHTFSHTAKRQAAFYHTRHSRSRNGESPARDTAVLLQSSQ